MLDDLREQAASSPFMPDDEPEIRGSQPRRPASRRKKQFLGLTPVQRFIMAVMLMLTVCLLGAMFLVITGKFWL
jgi:hypothetical protein